MICPTCHASNSTLFAKAKDWEYFAVPEEFTYMTCCECETIFLLDPPIGRLQEIYPSNYYSGSTSQNKSIIFKIKEYLDIRVFKNILSKIAGESLSVLDIGGGDGWVLNSVKKADKRIKETAIVDISSKARKNAEAQGHLFFNQTVENFSTDKKFDLILILNLIEHVEKPASVLNKLRSLLSPNGRILLKTPSTESLDKKLFASTYWGGLHCPRHWVLFTKNNLSKLANGCGLEVDKFSYTQGAPQWTMSILVMLANIGFINTENKKPLLEHFLATPLLALTAAFDFLRAPFAPTSQMFFLLKRT